MAVVFGENRHRFLGVCSTREDIVEYDEQGMIVWKMHVGQTVFDLWRLENGALCYCHYGNGESGVRVVTREGEIVTQLRLENEVFGCQPLPGGHLLAGELRKKRIVEADEHGNIVKVVPIRYDAENPHEIMRSVRRLPDGAYLVVSPGLRKIRIYDESGRILREYETRADTFGAVFRPNGNLLYSCMSGLFELNTDGREVWSVTEADVPEVNIRWLLGIHLKANGNVLCANWMGHGHDGEGIPVFEVTPDKRIVWGCDCREEMPNLGNFYLLDEEPDAETAAFPRR